MRDSDSARVRHSSASYHLQRSGKSSVTHVKRHQLEHILPGSRRRNGSRPFCHRWFPSDPRSVPRPAAGTHRFGRGGYLLPAGVGRRGPHRRLNRRSIAVPPSVRLLRSRSGRRDRGAAGRLERSARPISYAGYGRRDRFLHRGSRLGRIKTRRGSSEGHRIRRRSSSSWTGEWRDDQRSPRINLAR